MGLFDFIKKKLFGKTKKVEESKKEKEVKSEIVEKPKHNIKEVIFETSSILNVENLSPLIIQ